MNKYRENVKSKTSSEIEIYREEKFVIGKKSPHDHSKCFLKLERVSWEQRALLWSYTQIDGVRMVCGK